MNRVLKVLASVFFVNSVVMGSGGMIGGGEVSFKALMICDAASMDPTFPTPPYVWVVKEADYNGKFISDSTLRVVTVDKKHNAVRYYGTHQTELFESPMGFDLSIWRYDLLSDDNAQIGSFAWNAQSAKGNFVVRESQTEVEESVLTNCIGVE